MGPTGANPVFELQMTRAIVARQVYVSVRLGPQDDSGGVRGRGD